MAALNNLTEMATVALRNRREELRDNITNHNALLRRLNAKGKVDPADGGRTLVEELEYAENGTTKWFSGYENLDITPSDVFDAAEFSWKQMASTVSISGLERIKNSGKERIINLLTKRIENAKKSMANTAATAVYADGTGSSGKELGGLQHIVADTPTSGTVGGIDRASWTFWRNYTSGSQTITSSNINTFLNTAWLSLIRGVDYPDMITADATMYTYYWESLQQYARFSDSEMANAGFTALKYVKADFVYDDQAPTKRAYLLNTDYLYLRPHRETEFVVDKERLGSSQDSSVIPILWAGNMTCSNCALQGVIIDD